MFLKLMPCLESSSSLKLSCVIKLVFFGPAGGSVLASLPDNLHPSLSLNPPMHETSSHGNF